MTNPAYVHQAIISADGPPRPACGDSGPSVARAADVTCPDCLALAADRKARTEVHDTHAIPADDEPAAEPKPGPACPRCGKMFLVEDELVLGEEYTDAQDDIWKVVRLKGGLGLRFDEGDGFPLVFPFDEVRLSYGPLTKLRPTVDLSLPAPNADAPAKTHDLTVDRVHGNVVITVEGPEGEHQVYLQEGVAQDLGRVLAPLKTAQIALLIGELKGGEI